MSGGGIPPVRRDDLSTNPRMSPGRVRLIFGIPLVALALAPTERWVYSIVRYRATGFDVTDEAFYLGWAQRPRRPVARPGDFGFYLHWLLRLTGGSLASLRLLGLVLILAAAAASALSLTRWLPVGVGRSDRALAMVFLWAVLGASSCSYYALWLVTPSYNLLILVLGLLTFAGLIDGLRNLSNRTSSSDHECARPRAIGGLIVATWSAILLTDVKVTSGLVVCVLGIALVGFVSDRAALLPVGRSIAIGLGLGIATVLGVTGSPFTGLTKARRGAHALALSKSHTSEELWETPFVHQYVYPWLGRLAIAALLIALVWRLIRGARSRLIIVVVMLAVVMISIWPDRARGGTQVFGGGAGWWWLQCTGWCQLAITSLARTWSRILVVGPIVSISALGLAVGSNNGFIRQTALLTGIFTLGVLFQTVVVALQQSTVVVALPAVLFAAATAVASFSQVGEALADPYRLNGSISASTASRSIGPFGEIRVAPDLARYIDDLRKIAPAIPPEALHCLVDLSGGTPISALVLGANPAATPWLIGGYPGSDAAAEWLLQYAPCTSGEVLLIEAPGGDRAIARPSFLADRAIRRIGEVHFFGYLDEVQVLSLVAGTEVVGPG